MRARSISIFTFVCVSLILGAFAFAFPQIVLGESHNESAFGLTKEKTNPDKTKGKLKTIEGERSAGGKKSKKAGLEKSPETKGSSFETNLLPNRKQTVVIAIDSSRSYRRADPRGLRYQAAKLFARFLNEGDHIAVLSFDRDVAQVLPLTAVTGSSWKEIDSAIDHIQAEGGFSDLESPLSAALEVFKAEGSKNDEKTVLLLTDGGMDPAPSRGTAEQVSEKLFSEVLPEFQAENIHVYTPVVSEECDKAILAKVAEETKAESWFAVDIDSLHRNFSQFFLTLKRRSGDVEKKAEGFSIEPKTEEVTLLISDASQVSLVNPKGEMISNMALPAGVRWYKGEKIDVVTIKQPLEGEWEIHGVSDIKQQVQVLKQLELQVRWPEEEVVVGHPLEFSARFVDKHNGELPVALQNLVHYSLRIVASERGEVVYQKDLSEHESSAGKNVHQEDSHEAVHETSEHESGELELSEQESTGHTRSGAATIDEAGTYTAVVIVDGPTFTKFEEHSLEISQNPVTIERIPEDNFLHIAERIEVKISRELQKFGSLSVQLVAKREGTPRAILYPVKSSKDEAGLYTAKTKDFVNGQYQIVARVTGMEEGKGKKQSESAELALAITSGQEPTDENLSAVEYEGQAEEEMSKGIMFALGSIVVALLFTAYLVSRSSRLVGPSIPVHEYTPAAELLEKIENFRTKSSPRKREPTEQDFQEFSLVRKSFQERTTVDVKSETEAPTAAAPPEATVEGVPPATEASNAEAVTEQAAPQMEAAPAAPAPEATAH